MALPLKKESFKNLFAEIIIDDINISDFWRSWQISDEFKSATKSFGIYHVENNDRWDTIAETLYDDRTLWWLIVLFNKIENPFSIYFEDTIPESIKTLKIIKPENIGIILNEIRRKRLELEK